MAKIRPIRYGNPEQLEEAIEEGVAKIRPIRYGNKNLYTSYANGITVKLKIRLV
jgi:hypothetical protein